MVRANNLLWPLIWICILLGVAFHLALVLRESEMLADRPFRDDGFYALTVSRNLALSKGLSVSNGEIDTNGIQPVFVYLCSLPFIISQNRFDAIRLVLVLHLIIHLLSTVSIFFLVRSLTDKKQTPWVAAALWMCSYNILKFNSNGLETGLFLLMLICVGYFYIRLLDLEKLCFSRSFFFGFLLGLVTLTRIDAGILCLAMTVHYTLLHKNNGLIENFVRGPAVWFLGWLCITLPWWLYNINLTGNPLPISGLVQTMSKTTSSMIDLQECLINLWYAAHVILDNLLFVILTPLRMIKSFNEVSAAIMIVKLLVIFIFLIIVRRNKSSLQLKSLLPWKQLAFYPLFLLGLLVFYVFFFNVEWYMNRYLVPFAIGTVVLLSVILERLKVRYTLIMLTGAVLFTILISGYTYTRPFNTMYQYHWGWVRDNVSEDTWVGASQSGTLGYFHDRTINTDGKVNSELFGVSPNEVGTYLTSRDVEYFLEWEESYIFKDSSFIELYEYMYDYGLCQIWRRKGDFTPL